MYVGSILPSAIPFLIQLSRYNLLLLVWLYHCNTKHWQLNYVVYSGSLDIIKVTKGYIREKVSFC